MTRLRFVLALLALAGLAHPAAAAPTVTAPVVADVTDRSFSVVWTSSERATGTVEVYTDAAGANEITGTLAITPESPLFPEAESAGVLRVRVSGVSAGSTLYVRARTVAAAGGAVTVAPSTGPLPSVRIADGVGRTNATGRALVNDVLAVEVRAVGDAGPALGALVLLTVPGASHPVSAFSGEGAPAGYALLDLNDLVSTATFRSWPQAGGEPASLTALGGSAGRVDASGAVPLPSGLGNVQVNVLPRLVLSVALDTDGDGVTDDTDNCTFEPNPTQQDRGGRGSGSPPDGIGDACQCGDVNGDGRVTLADAVVISRSLLTPPTATRTRPELCDVGGPATCSLTDAVILRRALLAPPTAAISQVCPGATP